MFHSRSSELGEAGENKYGKKFDYDPLWNGPSGVVREVTDRVWLIIFGVFIVIYAITAMYALIAGDLSVFTAPTDSFGRHCGVDADVKDKKHLMAINLVKCSGTYLDCTPTICVSQCPSENFVYSDATDTNLETIKRNLICVPDIHVDSITRLDQVDYLIKHEKCAAMHLKSSPIMRMCVPDEDYAEYAKDEGIKKKITDAQFNRLKRIKLMHPIIASRVLGSIFPAIVVSVICGIIAFLYVYASRWFARHFFFGSLALVAVLTLILSLMPIYIADSMSPVDSSGSTRAMMIVLPVIFGIYALVIAFLIYIRKKIFLACEMIKESSRAVTHLFATLFFPILPWILSVLICIVFGVVTACILSLEGPSQYEIESYRHVVTDDTYYGSDLESDYNKRPDYDQLDNCKCGGSSYDNGDACDPSAFRRECKLENGKPCLSLYCTSRAKKAPFYASILHFINVLSFYWLWFFVSGFEYMVLGGTFATWYWTKNKEELNNSELSRSMYRTSRFHAGTVAFGSLIMMFVQMIRSGVEDSKRNNRHSFFDFFYYCLEKFIMFITNNAYLMCAIHGKNFIESAKMSFNLLRREFLNLFISTEVIDWIISGAQVVIVCLGLLVVYLYYSTTSSGNALYEFTEERDLQLGEVFYALILTFVLSAVIVTTIFSVQKAAANTILLCVLEDYERNDGSSSKPYFMSEKLKELLIHQQ